MKGKKSMNQYAEQPVSATAADKLHDIHGDIPATPAVDEADYYETDTPASRANGAKSAHGKKILVAAAVTALVVGVGVAGVLSGGKPEWLGMAKPASAVADNQRGEDRIVANVNGTDVNESEILNIVASGVDRAVAIDRYINKILAAQLAEKEYQKDAKIALRAAEREVLSTLYMQKRTQALTEAISEEDIKGFYDKNVREEDYKRYKVRYYLTQDVADGENTARAMVNKERDALAKLKYMKEGDDNMLTVGEIPYGLGRLVKDLKAGDISRPIVLRNGVFVLNLEEVKAQPKPAVDKVKGEIKNLLVAQRIGNELADKRKAARIELK